MHTKNNAQNAYKSIFSGCNSLFILHGDLSVDIRKFALGLILIFCGMITLSATTFSKTKLYFDKTKLYFDKAKLYFNYKKNMSIYTFAKQFP